MNKNHLISSIFVAFLCFTSISGTANADYQPQVLTPAQKKEVPLMVIRFNQPHVAFEKALYETMTEAFKTKPSAKFDVVSVSQRSSSLGEQKIYNGIAAENLKKVLATFTEMGMPQDRINLTTTSDRVKSSEVRIFVR